MMLPSLGLIGVLILLRRHISPAVLIVSVMACWAVFVLAMGVVIAAWQDWLAHLFHVGIRGRVTGTAWGLSSLVGVGGTLLAGWLLKLYPNLGTFGWLYLVAMLLAFVSITVYLKVRDPAEQEEQESVPRLRDMAAAGSSKSAYRRLPGGADRTLPCVRRLLRRPLYHHVLPVGCGRASL